jgi:hypothetical protein
MKRRPLVSILACSIGLAALATGCGTDNGPPPQPADEKPPAPVASLPKTVTEHLGKGPMPVYGANVYSSGQEIYKALRQEDSLMAFLTCQGEPDRVEVRENETPGAPPLIFLEYNRRAVARGTVEIEPTASGYYAAHPLDPSGSLKGPAKPPEHPFQPPPKSNKPSTPREPESRPREPEPTREAVPSPGPPAPPSKPEAPQPTAKQADECPIEPWRADCRSLCAGGATWEWCSYRD